MQYPVGCFIRWSDETYKVLQSDDVIAVVMDMDGTIIKNFRFYFEWEQAEKVEAPDEVARLEAALRPALTWEYCSNCSPDSPEECQK